MEESLPLLDRRHPIPRLMSHLERPIASALNNWIRGVTTGHEVPRPGEAHLPTAIHYTSIPTLLSILKNAENRFDHPTTEEGQAGNPAELGHVRMYSTQGFNDPQEGVFSRNVARDMAEDRSRSIPDADLLNRLIWGPSDRSQHYAYVASFISPDHNLNPSPQDHLEFWRAYGDDGHGCALSLTIEPTFLRQVKYGEQAAAEFVSGLWRTVAPLSGLVTTIHNCEIRTEMERRLRGFIQSRMQGMNYLFKSAAYQSENECRLVESPDSANVPLFEFRGKPKSGFITRYVEINELSARQVFKSGSSITLGPLVRNPQTTRRNVEDLLRQRGLFGCEVRCSEVPYQNPL